MLQSVVIFQESVLFRPLQEKGLMSEDEKSLLVRQLKEEVEEFEDAHDCKDYIGCIDALIDKIYFAIGGLHRLGLTPDEMAKCFLAVHDANMTKKRGTVERAGVASGDDAAKPEGWVSPEERIAEILGAPNDAVDLYDVAVGDAPAKTFGASI